jgi:hypothetical protein
LQRIKETYLLWHKYHSILPRNHRYSLGVRIDTIHIEIIEAVSAAAFLTKTDKIPYLRLAMRKLDTLKLLLLILFETKSIDVQKYISISVQVDEIGKMLGGWLGQTEKQNSPTNVGEK